MPNTRCAFDVVDKCSNKSCKFIHRKDEDDWDSAPILDRRAARLMIEKLTVTKQLRSLSTERNAKRRQSISNSAPEEPAAQESGEEKKEGKTSSSSEKKVVPQTPSSQKKSISSGVDSSFLLKCHLAMAGISNLALGSSEGSAEKIAKILKILGTHEL